MVSIDIGALSPVSDVGRFWRILILSSVDRYAKLRSSAENRDRHLTF